MNGRIVMKKLFTILLLVLVLCFVSGWQKAEEPAVDVEADIEAIKNLNGEWLKAYNAGDIDRIISIYADNAVQIPPNRPPNIGKEAIRGVYQWELDRFNTEFENEVVDVHVSDNLAFVRSSWTVILIPKGGGESIKFNGSLVFIHQRQQNSTWKVICESWSNEELIFPPPEKNYNIQS